MQIHFFAFDNNQTIFWIMILRVSKQDKVTAYLFRLNWSKGDCWWSICHLFLHHYLVHYILTLYWVLQRCSALIRLEGWVISKLEQTLKQKYFFELIKLKFTNSNSIFVDERMRAVLKEDRIGQKKCMNFSYSAIPYPLNWETANFAMANKFKWTPEVFSC